MYYLYLLLFFFNCILYCAEEAPDHVLQLHAAVERKEKHKVQSLLGQHPEDVDSQHEGLCPLHRATRHQDLVIVKVLLEHKAFIDPIQEATGSTPLHLVFTPNASVNAVVPIHGGPVPNGHIPIRRMHETNIQEIVRQLVINGAAIHLPNKDKQTPFTLAEAYPQAQNKMIELYNKRQQGIKTILEGVLSDASVAEINRLIAEFTG